MTRREAVSAVGILLGGTIIGADFFLSGCKTETKKSGVRVFSQDDIAYLDEIAETILPATSSPGAKAAGVGSFMTVMVNDCYEEKDQLLFFEGMNTINEACRKKFSKTFMEASPEQRHELLVEADKEEKDYRKNKKSDEPNHYFRLMKELVLLGYFTSETGATKALRYIETPGRYDGNFPYKKGDKAWAS